MISVHIPNFLELLRIYKVQNEKVKQLEAEMTVQQMITLNQQNLLEDSQLVAFFKNIEVTDILSYFEKDLVLDMKFKRPRILACFREISKYQRHIRWGIVREIYINTSYPEDYQGYISDICSQKLREYTTRFRKNFMFCVWSIWKERNYIKLFPSVQISELHTIIEQPNY